MYKSGIFVLLTILSQIFIAGCAHYPNVRPASGGIHEVSFLTDRHDQGYKKAFNEAKDFCEDRYQQYPAIISEHSEYVGTMDEETYNSAKTAAQVVGAVGVAGVLLGGGEKDRDVGTVAAVGGGIADGVIGSGYQFTMKFKCQ